MRILSSVSSALIIVPALLGLPPPPSSSSSSPPAPAAALVVVGGSRWKHSTSYTSLNSPLPNNGPNNISSCRNGATTSLRSCASRRDGGRDSRKRRRSSDATRTASARVDGSTSVSREEGAGVAEDGLSDAGRRSERRDDVRRHSDDRRRRWRLLLWGMLALMAAFLAEDDPSEEPKVRRLPGRRNDERGRATSFLVGLSVISREHNGGAACPSWLLESIFSGGLPLCIRLGLYLVG
mmetsp:Transcript_11468/g.28251  ORF Transcript_11468/g.28251 Transcript_11468/m.28251 type:complete len:237 (-) Transcript_11468:349-1059(-)